MMFISTSYKSLDILCYFFNNNTKIGMPMIHGDYPACVKDFNALEPIYEVAEGWSEDISKCRRFEELPSNAKKYIERISQLIGVPIKWVGVGQDNDSTIYIA